ncbi:hypothetical protein BC361_29500 [Ensifer sp. LC54]|nr:hypothetical protein BC361_29500 [Ensifer sp. LC54]OCP21094.1 hypothetical protein BC363_28800 [Ensifer sp. LC384]
MLPQATDHGVHSSIPFKPITRIKPALWTRDEGVEIILGWTRHLIKLLVRKHGEGLTDQVLCKARAMPDGNLALDQPAKADVLAQSEAPKVSVVSACPPLRS